MALLLDCNLGDYVCSNLISRLLSAISLLSFVSHFLRFIFGFQLFVYTDILIYFEVALTVQFALSRAHEGTTDTFNWLL